MNIPYTSIKTCDSEPPPSHSIVQNARCMVFPSAMMSDIVSMGSRWVRIIAGRRPANFSISTWLILDWFRDFPAASSRTKTGKRSYLQDINFMCQALFGRARFIPRNSSGSPGTPGVAPEPSNGAFGQIESLWVISKLWEVMWFLGIAWGSGSEGWSVKRKVWIMA